MIAIGGIEGLGVALGGCVEYQMNDNRHFHGNLHIASAYQHKSLKQIEQLMEARVISLDDVAAFQEHICREEHFDQELHEASLEKLEENWKTHNQSKECDKLCQLPAFIAMDDSRTMWDEASPVSLVVAEADGAAFKQQYHADAQVIVFLAPRILPRPNLFSEPRAQRPETI